MPISFRGGFYGGLIAALLVGVFLVWLWQPGRQVRRHTENFLHAIEHKNWTGAADFIGSDITISGATIGRVFLKACTKVFDMCEVLELAHSA